MDDTQDPIIEEKKTADNPDAKWYIVHTYAGHENKVARSLKQRMEAMGFADRIFDMEKNDSAEARRFLYG